MFRSRPGRNPTRTESAIDRELEAFASGLPPDLRAVAVRLASTLGLAPAGVPWSEVFGHEVTLGAPSLVAPALPGLSRETIGAAVRAHALAVIGAFGEDRIEDGQVAATAELRGVLAAMGDACRAALERCSPGAADAFSHARAATTRAIAEERAVLASGSGVDLREYVRVSLGKQQVGVPASVALVKAAGRGERVACAVARMLEAVWLGLQLHDDVIDWEDDLARSGGAWAVAIAGGAAVASSGAREAVAASAALPRMLQASARFFRAARRRAALLGASTLAAWSLERERAMGDLAAKELASPGFARRARALANWAGTFLV